MAVAPVTGHIFLELADGVVVEKRATTHRLLGVDEGEYFGPQAFLADVKPDEHVGSHFHPVDQFQVMYGAPGAFYQRSPVPKVFLHYADAYSVYGPFGAGPEVGFEFFTLRAMQTRLHGAMPERRAELLYRGERHLQVNLESLLEGPPVGTGSISVDTLIPPHADGLAAYFVRIAPGVTAAPPEGELRTGRYTVVIEGSAEIDGRTFGEKAVGFSSGDGPDIEVTAGSEGATVLFMHLPFPATQIAHLQSA
jgi:hypothetical protein